MEYPIQTNPTIAELGRVRKAGVSFRPEAWRDPDEAMMEEYLVALGRALQVIESQFLLGKES
jgi:hypothetical protein